MQIHTYLKNICKYIYLLSFHFCIYICIYKALISVSVLKPYQQSNKIPVVACYNVALCFKFQINVSKSLLQTFMTYVNFHILGHNLNDNNITIIFV